MSNEHEWTEEERAAFRKSGRKGGAATSQRYGPDHYAALGRKGGARTRDVHGPEHYRAIGSQGGKKKWEAAP